MASGEDWLFRPVNHRLCHFESVIDGTLSLDDIATMNEMIDVDVENRGRIDRWLSKKGSR